MNTNHTPTLDKVNAAIDSAPARLHGVRNAFAQIREAVEQAETERAELVAALQAMLKAANAPWAGDKEWNRDRDAASEIARAALAKVGA